MPSRAEAEGSDRVPEETATPADGSGSEPRNVRQLPRRRLDRRPGLEQHRRRIPRPPHELVARSVGHGRLDDAVAEAYLLLLDVHRHRLLRLTPDRLLQPLQILLRRAQARNAQHHAVAEEDLAEGAADDGLDAPAHESLRGVLTRGAAAEVLADHEHRGAAVHRLVERMLGVLLLRVLEGVLAHGLEGHFLEKARGDDAVGVDVVAGQGNAASRDLAPLEVGDGAHRRISLTSATAPVIAAAATMAGLMSRVRPVGLPCRPMKLRLLDEALISRPTSWSGFMPRHIEQPALRHWKPAAWKISCRPSASAAFSTCCEPGTISARTWLATLPFLATSAAARRSDNRPLVHEPTNATSIFAPLIGWPAAKPMWASASRNVDRSASGADSGAGMRWFTPTDMPGLMPHVTVGSIAPPSRRATSSNAAPASVAIDFHHSAARSNAAPCGAYGRPRTYSMVVASGLT